MKNKALLIISIFLIFNVFYGFSQNRKYYNNLKNSKKNTLTYSKELLKNIKGDNDIDKLLLIGEQIRKQKEIIYIINRELKLLTEEINVEENKIKDLNINLEKQRDEYAALIYYASLNMNVQRNMIFILSADNFNKAYKRIIYLKQLTDFRKQRSNEIKENIIKVDSSILFLTDLKKEKEILVKNKASELDSLNIIKKQLNKIINKNNSDSKKVEIQLKKEKEKKSEIIKIVKERIEEEEKKSTIIVSKNKELKGNITQKFRDKKRWHIWPLKKCVVLHRFGDYHHPKFSNIIVKNDGIEIGAKGDNNVHSIFEGVVSSIVPIPGDGTSIIIKHGDFYSVYSKIDKINIAAGDVVTKGQIIGKMPKNKNMAKMIFQIWYKKQKLNPELWLKKR